jgi:hypothetical protein
MCLVVLQVHFDLSSLYFPMMILMSCQQDLVHMLDLNTQFKLVLGRSQRNRHWKKTQLHGSVIIFASDSHIVAAESADFFLYILMSVFATTMVVIPLGIAFVDHVRLQVQ